ncbi:MAG: hypothetical protein R8P61_35370 [Bacteroidia bacterium]|nr:hypothetical protein [Bacteroidia bacterium]
MKTSLLIIGTLLLAQLSFAQSYSVELAELPTTPGESLAWDGANNAPEIKFLSTQNGFWGGLKKGRIFVEGDHKYSIVKKGTRYFLYNDSKATQMVRYTNAYLALDGTELKRKTNVTGDRISIIHPDGTVLAEGKIKSKLLGKHTLALNVLQDSPYTEEITALLSVDLVETLKNRYDWTPVVYTADSN